ncbi:FUSE-binding protein 2 / KH-type splicing regulatory protein [Toxoplasma gondii RUB]|uniref:FUSE-binding protein 2 / KH-type splicing regulatory protein n=7 Tax=Toxoplasma gondii TaxID=5811 RepID=S7VUJ0_TOXGG|nr:FUSE-binding protein 2 / KH-type splicing regulatory protein [Toxoplasma gondii GT1]KAF4639820.1 FUSE-binding protein 2 / KH-type splicing regulatory protein [Toxoplasma gondii]KFG58433.1 FUSE-binding protein 2 / KH-type splicing regulatory protein [Toxoplasma gondii RUB]KFH01188.1 FUSE-binding protein 2 / KH-type splicing regulatory protein [Toxoplasma gondii VAND]RQX67259.1 FUSE-binding protein 2 / KH-type splicing regulatory protein [Toxoplasma gondii CAST]
MARKKRGSAATPEEGETPPAGQVAQKTPETGSAPQATEKPKEVSTQDLLAATALVARPQVDTSNLSASQKKNLKKKIRKQEQRQQEAAVLAVVRPEAKATGMASHYAEQEAPLRRRLEALKRAAGQQTRGSGAPSAKKLSQDVEAVLREIDGTLEREVAALQKPLSKRVTVQQLQQQIRDVEAQVQKQQRELQRQAHQGEGESAEIRACLDESLRYVVHLREQLILTQQQNELRVFRDRLGALKAEGEGLLKALHASGSPGGERGRAGHAGNGSASPSGAKEAQWRRRLGDLSRGGPERRRGPKPAEEEETAQPQPLVVQHVSLGPDAMGLLFPGGQNPVLVRKLERACGLVLDKQSGGAGRAGTVAVVGLQAANVDRGVALLNSLDEGMQPEKREKHRVQVEGRSIGSVIGAGGANLRRVEEDNDVVVWAEGNEMIVMGATAAKIAAGIRQLKEVVASPVASASGAGSPGGATSLVFPVPIARALAGASFRSFLRELETAFHCSVRAPKGGSEGLLLVQQATPENAAAAAKRLQDEAAKLVVKTVSADGEKVLKLLKGNAPGFTASSREKDRVTYLRGENELTVVGPSEEIDAAVKAAEEGLLLLDRVTGQVSVSRDLSRIVTRAKRAHIEKETGVTFRPPRSPAQSSGDLVLSFLGTKEQVEAARAMLTTLLKEEGHSEAMGVGKEMTAALLAERGQGVRDLEEQFGVSVSIERREHRLVVRGGEAAVQACVAALRERQEREFADEKDEGVLERVPVPKDMVAAIIGRHGARIRKIQTQSGVESIRMDGTEGVAAIRGAPAAVEKAVKLIEEALKEAAAGAIVHASDNGDEETRTGEAGQGKPRRGPQRAQGTRRTPQNPLSVDASDEAAFPSLDATLTEARNKASGGRWKRGARGAAKNAEEETHGVNGVANGTDKREDRGVTPEEDAPTAGTEVCCN